MSGKQSSEPPSASEREPMPDEHLLKPDKGRERAKNAGWLFFAVILVSPAVGYFIPGGFGVALQVLSLFVSGIALINFAYKRSSN